MDLALNNLQRLICHKTQQTKPNKLDSTTSVSEFDSHWVLHNSSFEQKLAKVNK